MVSSPNTDKVYIGSTVQSLTARFARHKAVSNHTRSVIIIAAGDAKITELFKFETCTVQELRDKEHQNTKNICCVCGGKYTHKNKTQHFKSKKHVLGQEFEKIKVNGKECSIA